MRAAAAGRSSIGIPKSVGKKYVKADKRSPRKGRESRKAKGGY